MSAKLAFPGSKFQFAMRSIGGRFQEQACAQATPGKPDQD
mgnify:CR=1 FL=1|jgi:hypothetical protein